METQDKLEIEIGEIESENKSLEPKRVKIVDTEIVAVGEKKSLKVNCKVAHPDHDSVITLSSVAYLRDKKVITTGLWFNLDKEGKIQKGSALALFLNSLGAKTLKEIIGLDVDTDLEGKYLCFKAY